MGVKGRWHGQSCQVITIMVRSCVNPDHLECVTNRINTLRGNTVTGINYRKTHCPRGHEYNEQNTERYLTRRKCRICRREGNRKRRMKIRKVV